MSKVIDIWYLLVFPNCGKIRYMFSKQKRYFRKKLWGVQCMLWDMDFKRYKTLYVREQIRQEYDNSRSKLEILKTNIAAEKDKPTLPVDEFKRLEDNEVRLNEEIEKKVAQMKQLDIEINGSPATVELPEGYQGINQTMDGLRELAQVTKKYIKEL